MNEFRHDFLARSGFARDQNAGGRRSDLFGDLHNLFHDGVFENDGRRLNGKSGKHFTDQFGVGRQGDILFRAGFNGADGGAGIGFDAASDDGDADPFVFQTVDQRVNVQFDVRHDQIDALSVSQQVQRVFDGIGG